MDLQSALLAAEAGRISSGLTPGNNQRVNNAAEAELGNNGLEPLPPLQPITRSRRMRYGFNVAFLGFELFPGQLTAIRCLGRRRGTSYRLQGPAKMDIALGKGYFDTLLVEPGIDGAVEVADNVQTPVDIVDEREILDTHDWLAAKPGLLRGKGEGNIELPVRLFPATEIRFSARSGYG